IMSRNEPLAVGNERQRRDVEVVFERDRCQLCAGRRVPDFTWGVDRAPSPAGPSGMLRSLPGPEVQWPDAEAKNRPPGLKTTCGSRCDPRLFIDIAFTSCERPPPPESP